MRRTLKCIALIAMLLVLLGIACGPRAIFVATWLAKFPGYSDNVTRWGLPLHPTAVPHPYGTWGGRRHMHFELIGRFRFFVPRKYEQVRAWYLAHLPPETWDTTPSRTTMGDMLDAWPHDMDGVTECFIRVRPVGPATMVHYRVPRASETCDRDARRLRQIHDEMTGVASQ